MVLIITLELKTLFHCYFVRSLQYFYETKLDVFSGLPMTETDVLAQLEEPRQPHMNVGRDFQAELPELCNNRIDLHRAPEQLLWDPGINDALDDNEGKYNRNISSSNNKNNYCPLHCFCSLQSLLYTQVFSLLYFLFYFISFFLYQT